MEPLIIHCAHTHMHQNCHLVRTIHSPCQPCRHPSCVHKSHCIHISRSMLVSHLGPFTPEEHHASKSTGNMEASQHLEIEVHRYHCTPWEHISQEHHRADDMRRIVACHDATHNIGMYTVPFCHQCIKKTGHWIEGVYASLRHDGITHDMTIAARHVKPGRCMLFTRRTELVNLSCWHRTACVRYPLRNIHDTHSPTACPPNANSNRAECTGPQAELANHACWHSTACTVWGRTK
jgi:hypothetical protein